MPKGDGNRGKSKGLDWIKAHLDYAGDDCLPWPFSGCWNGYGQMLYDGRIQKAHRVMCIEANGEPPPKHVAAHSCNNGHLACMNRRHLSWKTHRQNLLDRRAAGTLTKKRWSTKESALSNQQMERIIALKGEKNQREIAAMFGISYQHVSVIQNRKLRCQAA